MSRTLRHRLTGLAALASLQAVMLGGTALAQAPVQIFEEPPPMALLRSIMVPESQPGQSRRIVITQPERPVPMISEAVAVEPPTENAAPVPAAPRRPRWQAPALPVAPVLASARQPAPETTPPAEGASARRGASGSIGFRINFGLNSDAVPPSAVPFMTRIAELMRDQPQVKLQVEGHTDALGSDAYNLHLSQRRAAAVANYLVEREGIEPARLLVRGRGEEAPLTDNPFDPRNRRVQFERVD